jgi:hypothetical protein
MAKPYEKDVNISGTEKLGEYLEQVFPFSVSSPTFMLEKNLNELGHHALSTEVVKFNTVEKSCLLLYPQEGYELTVPRYKLNFGSEVYCYSISSVLIFVQISGYNPRRKGTADTVRMAKRIGR